MFPDSLQQILARLAQGHSLSRLAQDYDRLSNAYRTQKAPRQFEPTEALAYALARMPATFAANQRAFETLHQRYPAFFSAIKTVADLGSGPGTASLALQHFSPIPRTYHLVERDRAMIALGQNFSPAFPHTSTIHWHNHLLSNPNLPVPIVDLIILSYSLGELSSTQQSILLALAWAKIRHGLLLVEPGTSVGARTIQVVREFAHHQSATILAPCCHAGVCPLAQLSDQPASWCHFSVRVARSALARQIKQASQGWEDEPFSFLALLKPASPLLTSLATLPSTAGRLLDQPIKTSRGLTFRLCGPHAHQPSDLPTLLPKKILSTQPHFRRLKRGDLLLPLPPTEESPPNNLV